MQLHDLNYYTIIPDGVLKDETLTDTDFKTLIVIYSLTRIDGYCSMSNGQLAQLLGKSKENAIQKRIANLINKKFLIRVLEEHPWGTLRKLYMPEKFYSEAHQSPENVKKRHSPTPNKDSKKEPTKTFKNDFKLFVKYVRELPFPFNFVSPELEGVPHKYVVKNGLLVNKTDGRMLGKEESRILWKWLNSNQVKPKVLKILEAEILKREGF